MDTAVVPTSLVQMHQLNSLSALPCLVALRLHTMALVLHPCDDPGRRLADQTLKHLPLQFHIDLQIGTTDHFHRGLIDGSVADCEGKDEAFVPLHSNYNVKIADLSIKSIMPCSS